MSTICNILICNSFHTFDDSSVSADAINLVKIYFFIMFPHHN